MPEVHPARLEQPLHHATPSAIGWLAIEAGEAIGLALAYAGSVDSFTKTRTRSPCAHPFPTVVVGAPRLSLSEDIKFHNHQFVGVGGCRVELG